MPFAGRSKGRGAGGGRGGGRGGGGRGGGRGTAKAPVKAALPLPPPADDDLEVDEEDVAFFAQQKRGRFLANAALTDERPAKKRAVVREEVYERVARSFAEPPPEAHEKVEVDALPLKNESGEWVYEKRAAKPEPAAAAAKPPKGRKAEDAVPPTDALARSVEALKDLQAEELTLEEKRGRIAAAATALMEAPERNASELKALQRLAGDENPTIARLACLSAMLVYKDLAPGYRIRLPTEKELEMAVSKEVRAVRDYETAFLKGYQSFLKLLLAAVGEKGGGKAGGVDCRTAVRCMCSLLRALPNFNYRTDLLRALIPLLGSEDETVAAATCEAVGRVLSDCGGEAALEAVQLLAEFVKNCECQAPEHTLDVLRSLRFSENLALRLRDDREAGKPMTQKQKNRKWIEERRRLRDEAKTSARSGEADKPVAAPESDEHDFREFEAVPDVAALLQLQTKMLEAVCEIYFRVLKAAIVPNGPSGWPLLKPTLAGLARVSYLIDYEVVTDVLEVLRKLLAQGELSNDLQAALLLTACQVLEGQGAGLVAVDFRDFHRHLYRLAACSPSIEAGRLWSSAAAAGSVGERGQQASKLWIRSMSAMLLARAHRQVDTERVAAFAKRLAEVSLHVEAGEVLGSLAIVRELVCRHPRLRRLLENEPGTPGAYSADALEPEGASAMSSTLWEVALLQAHPHQSIASLAAHIASMPVEDAPAAAFYGAATPEELVDWYSTLTGSFRPSIPPTLAGRARRPLRDSKAAGFLAAAILEEEPGPDAADFSALYRSA